jgi:4-hydroxybenzoyl-CoA reductase subunit beta
MMRLPTDFGYRAPRTAREVVKILAGEGPGATVVAGGTDLYPNMKRRHQVPKTLVGLRRVRGLAGLRLAADGTLSMGAATTLRAVERDARVRKRLPGLRAAVVSISTPVLRNMGTIGGNVCLDTRCNYYDQTWEWRRAIDFCMKCEGDTCWVAPGSDRCWAVNSSDSVPVLIAMGARAALLSPEGERIVPVADLFRDDGIAYLTKRPDELLLRLEVPPQADSRTVYRKVRRRGAFDFPVLGVAVRLATEGGVVRDAAVVLNAVGSAPVVCAEAREALLGRSLTDEVVAEAAARAWRPAKPLDNTDHASSWRKRMVKVEVARALRELAPAGA